MIVTEKVLEAFQDLEIEGVGLNDHLESELAMDSQELVELVIILAKRFNIQLSIDDLANDMTVSEVISLVSEKSSSRTACNQNHPMNENHICHSHSGVAEHG